MTATPKSDLDPTLIDTIADRVAQGLRVRRTLPPDGRVHIDRQLPFLVVYRPPAGLSDPALRSLVASQASYVIAPSDPKTRRFTHDLVERVATLQADTFGGFLIVELWVNPRADGAESVAHDIKPDFGIAIPRQLVDSSTVTTLAKELARIKILGQSAHVAVRPSVPLAPPHERRVIPVAVAKTTKTMVIGVAAAAVWRSSDTEEVYPLVRRAIVRQVSRSLAQTAFVFAKDETSSRPLHYQALGRRAVVRAVRNVDHQLADVAEAFDLLLAVTPVNAEGAYQAFRRARFGKQPRFQYRPITIDPSLLKRKLFNIKIERVEDPTLEALFREKRRELELKLSLIGDRMTVRFLPTSIALYGQVDDASVVLARQVLESLPLGKDGRPTKRVSGAEFAAMAEIELAGYRAVDSSITPYVDLRDDVSSLMVSGGSLLVGKSMSIPADRVDALLQHEVGTHVVTYWNGRAQPFRLLASGLARHDELQEGLAVFAEYIVGGLTPTRLRTLAARVLAARAVSDGAEFIETYRLLVDDVGVSARNAFLMSMRVHRGGGLVKDAVYLRGLQGVVDYVGKGGRLDTLLVGKIAPEHTAVIEELQRREILHTPPLRPNFLNGPDAHYRIERVRDGIDLVNLIDRQ